MRFVRKQVRRVVLDAISTMTNLSTRYDVVVPFVTMRIVTRSGWTSSYEGHSLKLCASMPCLRINSQKARRFLRAARAARVILPRLVSNSL